MTTVNNKAFVGSLREELYEKGLMKGIISSLAIAWSKRGAPKTGKEDTNYNEIKTLHPYTAYLKNNGSI